MMTTFAASVAPANPAEDLFFDLALEDLTEAADLFQPIFDAHRRCRRLGLARSFAAARP